MFHCFDPETHLLDITDCYMCGRITLKRNKCLVHTRKPCNHICHECVLYAPFDKVRYPTLEPDTNKDSYICGICLTVFPKIKDA